MATTPHNTKKVRNARIVQLIDSGKSFSEAARAVRLKTSSTAHKIYWREKIRKARRFPANTPPAMQRMFATLVR